MTTKIPIYYWDAQCWIAFFNREETTDPVYLAALETTYREMLAGHVHLMVCTLFYSEVLDIPLPEKTLEALSTCPYFTFVETTTAVHRLAGELRKRCKEVGQKLRTPDATHIAAGQIARATEIWTVDKALVNKSRAGLLVNTPVVYPHVDQVSMDFDASL